MKYFCYPLLLLLFSVAAKAQNGEQSRLLVHTLNYISHDYQFAVKDGKISSAAEYKEEEEFSEAAVKNFKLYSTKWSDSDSVAIGILIDRLANLIAHHAEFKEVAAVAIEAKNRVITASGLIITPAQFPNLETGKIIYKTDCAKCHGATGYGDGAEGKDLEPKPRNFHDAERMRSISPFFAFNTIRLGIEGTGMKAHPILEDEEVWDVAFYISTLRFQDLATHPFLKTEEAKKNLSAISPADAAVKSDDDFLSTLNIKDSLKAKLVLAAIRFHQPEHSDNDFIKTSLQYLDCAMLLYNEKKYTEASQMAALSYLEGIEPIENRLKATDPSLLTTLEEQMQHLRKMMEESRPAIEVKDSINTIRVTVKSAGELLNKKEYSFWLAFFMAASVLFREGLEAFLVIMVILSVIKAGNLSGAKKWVHSGWILAVAIGCVLFVLSENILDGNSTRVELTEGVISFIAVAMLLYVGFWLHGKSEISRWKDYVKGMMKGVMDNKSMVGLGALSFFVVFREVFESVLFLSALRVEAGAAHSSAILFGVLWAFAVVLIFAFVVLRFSAKLPIPTLFKISSFVMGVLAIVLAGKGAHSLQEIGIIPVHGISFSRIELIGLFPTVESVSIQLIVLILVIAMRKLSK